MRRDKCERGDAKQRRVARGTERHETERAGHRQFPQSDGAARKQKAGGGNGDAQEKGRVVAAELDGIPFRDLRAQPQHAFGEPADECKSVGITSRAAAEATLEMPAAR